MKQTIKLLNILSVIILVKFLLITTCCADVREESILNKPIIEGKSIAGINIADYESDIYKALGFPDKFESDFSTDPQFAEKGLKLLIYSLGEGDILLIYTRHQRVDAIFLVGNPGEPSYKYKGKTTKGIGLGDFLDSLKRKYGKPDREDICWYKNYGIAFGIDEKGIIGAIQITMPNALLPDYMRINQ